MRRIALTAVAFILGASTVLLAGPAQAADSLLDCDAGNGTVNVTLALGATYTIENSDQTATCAVSSTGSTLTWVSSSVGDLPNPNPTTLSPSPNPPITTLTVTGIAPGLQSLAFTTSGGTVTYNFTVTGIAGGDSSSAPAPILQEFGRPTSGTCDAAEPADLDWGGVPSGGWANSWSQWMNDGTGGAVCTRTLVYSNNLGTWTIG